MLTSQINDTQHDEELDSDSDFDETELSGAEGDLAFNPLLMVKSSVSEETIYKYKDMVKRDNIYGNRIMILLLILVYFMSTVILITVREIIDNSTLIFILRAIFCGSQIIVFVFIPLAYSKAAYKMLVFAIFLYSCVPTLL